MGSAPYPKAAPVGVANPSGDLLIAHPSGIHKELIRFGEAIRDWTQGQGFAIGVMPPSSIRCEGS